MSQENSTPPAMPQEAQDAIKNLMFDSFYSHFTAMMNTIRKWPLPQHMMQILVKEFDNGLLWTKEAAQGMVLPAPKQPTSPASEMKVVDATQMPSEAEQAA